MSPDSHETLASLPFPETQHRFPSSDGVEVAAYDWGGNGPPLVLAHATGLHAHVWIPLVLRLRTAFHCYGVDLRAQGETGRGEPPSLSWDRIGDDFAAALVGLGLAGRGDVFGIGHSMGGFAVLDAEMRRPGTFAHLFGFEPVVFPRLDEMPEQFRKGDNTLADAARKRREVFPMRTAAYDNYRGKMPLMAIDDDVLRAYVHWGFDDLDDGTVRLKCRAESEADLFSQSYTDALYRLDEVTCPVLLGLSEFTNDGFRVAVPMQADRLPNATLRHFPDRSHFGPLERTSEMADIVTSTFLRMD